jgi:hypothetical protein
VRGAVGTAEQADEADEALGGTVAGTEVPPRARAVPYGRGHRFAAYPRCWTDRAEIHEASRPDQRVISSMRNEELGSAFVNFDFTRWFPHVFWVSDWKEDESYPGGYRYKVLSVRDVIDQRVEVVVVLEERNGPKTEMARVSGPLSGVRGMAIHFTDGLAGRFGLTFQEQDFSTVRDEEAFDANAKEYGWTLSGPSE